MTKEYFKQFSLQPRELSAAAYLAHGVSRQALKTWRTHV